MQVIVGNFEMEVGEIMIQSTGGGGGNNELSVADVAIYSAIGLVVIILVLATAIIVVIAILVYRWRVKKRVENMRSEFLKKILFKFF